MHKVKYDLSSFPLDSHHKVEIIQGLNGHTLTKSCDIIDDEIIIIFKCPVGKVTVFEIGMLLGMLITK